MSEHQSYVRPNKPYIYVSYAQVDNKPVPQLLPGQPSEGWITSFIKILKIVLDQLLGGEKTYDLWMDVQMATNAEVTPEKTGKIRDAAILLLIFSPAYRNSKWCQKEMLTFLREEAKRRRDAGSAVFVVEFGKEDRPPELADLLGTQFWVEDPVSRKVHILGFPWLIHDDADDYARHISNLGYDLAEELNCYYNRVSNLGSDLADELKRMERAAGAAGDELPTVYLAEVTDENLDNFRTNVKDYLIDWA